MLLLDLIIIRLKPEPEALAGLHPHILARFQYLRNTHFLHGFERRCEKIEVEYV